MYHKFRCTFLNTYSRGFESMSIALYLFTRSLEVHEFAQVDRESILGSKDVSIRGRSTLVGLLSSIA